MKRYLPIFLVDTLYHIGDLSKPAPAATTNSFEGNCLSVSLCPETWVRIARLPGACHRLSAAAPFTLLDMHSVQRNDALRDKIRHWAQAQGYIYPDTRWLCWKYDGEQDSWYSIACPSEEDACLELAEEEPLDNGDYGAPKGHTAVEPATVWLATPGFAERMRQAHYAERDVTDLAVIAWAEETQPALAGVWWADVYDPGGLSCPRGGIFASRVPHVEKVRLKERDWPGDDDESDGLQQGRLVEQLTWRTYVDTARSSYQAEP